MRLSKQDVDYILSYRNFGKYLIDRYNQTSLQLVKYYELKTFNLPGYTVDGFNYWQWCSYEVLRTIKQLLKEKQ